MDPLEITRRHPGCKFHLNKSKLESLSLSYVYRYIHNKDLECAHNSLVDSKAETDVVLHTFFKGYWDTNYSVRYIADMWKSKTIKKANKKGELVWPVPRDWNTDDNIKAWGPANVNTYEGPCGGPQY